MFRGFNVTNFTFRENAEEYRILGESIHNRNKKLVRDRIDSFKNAEGHLVAAKICANWFPEVNADIFLSHSHQDEALVLQLAGWLKKSFGLTSFIDSTVWGYSEKILRMIDDEYCLDKNGRYNYNKRNRSTSHVYMMLTIALTKMLDACECVFFINTPKSIAAKENIQSEGITYSPWIYSEIAMTSLIRRRAKEEHKGRRLLKAANESYTFDSIEVAYDVDLSHLTPLSHLDLTRWLNSTKLKGVQALDKLYDLNK
ncbi:hypothetical protein [Burkholderia thailandensis]|uniref:hypothetical protein n=1 Tax=Burkholderia thailandensis TaxID=57975 RepID=UPI0012E913A0|nr:hypothetical protein [Burkholderia thailandensis]MCS3396910.1 toll/interleukin-1 receptor domain-containing protein [Burkholderia thailandensis]MUV27193.1 hypothetical protein [Burkholderia thailandensis]QIO10876.1 hypothetical protein G9462_02010 [Burkholderia thailandensis]